MYYTRSIFVLCGWVKYRSKDSKVKLWNILGFVVLPKITVYLTEYFNTMYNFNMKPELKNSFIPFVGNRKVIGKCMNGSNFEYEIITCFFNWIWYRILNNLHEFDLTRFDCNCMKLENSLLIVWVVHVMQSWKLAPDRQTASDKFPGGPVVFVISPDRLSSKLLSAAAFKNR